MAAQTWPRAAAIRHTAGVPTSPSTCSAGAIVTRPSVSIETESVSPFRKSAWVATTQKPVLAAWRAAAPLTASASKAQKTVRGRGRRRNPGFDMETSGPSW